MVQLEKVQGQRGHMVVHEDGTIISSSGELASSENTASQMVSMISHTLQVSSHDDPSIELANNGSNNGGGGAINGAGDNNHTGQLWKWNKITVDFGDHAYTACVSNRKVHIVKRDNAQPPLLQPSSHNTDNF